MIGYIKSKQEFLNEKNEEIINNLIELYPTAEDSQVKSWETLIKDLKQSTKISFLLPEAVVAIEYSLPNDDMGIDALIAFQQGTNRYVFIIEAKQWSDEYIYNVKYSVKREFGKELHPQVQCEKYVLSFKDYLDIGQNYNVFPIVFIRNCSKDGLQHLIKHNPNGESNIPCFNKIDDVINYILTFQKSSKVNLIEELKNAAYKPSKSIIDSMKSLVTQEAPFILTDEQQRALSVIHDAIKSDKKIIRITGVAGSGKTAILLHIFVSYLRNLEKHSKIPIFISGAQNTNLYRSLYPKVKELFEYSFTANKKIPKTKGSNYIVFMDEAQHNATGIISEIIEKKATLIICYDEEQTINANNALNELKELEQRSDFVSIRLTDSVRYNNSKVAETNIKKLISGSTDFQKDEKFELKLFTDYVEFQNKIISTIESNPDNTIAVVGLLSNDASQYSIEQNSESIFYIDWEKNGECNWIPYIKEKNYLAQNNGKIWVGTWWLPGLDVDYVAVIIGGDAKLTSNGIVAIPEQAKHYQMMVSIAEKLGFLEQVKIMKKFYGKLSIDNKSTVSQIINYINQRGNENLKKQFLKDFSKYLSNNYYIMLTRGRKGCFVYFANNEVV